MSAPSRSSPVLKRPHRRRARERPQHAIDARRVPRRPPVSNARPTRNRGPACAAPRCRARRRPPRCGRRERHRPRQAGGARSVAGCPCRRFHRSSGSTALPPERDSRRCAWTSWYRRRSTGSGSAVDRFAQRRPGIPRRRSARARVARARVVVDVEGRLHRAILPLSSCMGSVSVCNMAQRGRWIPAFAGMTARACGACSRESGGIGARWGRRDAAGSKGARGRTRYAGGGGTPRTRHSRASGNPEP